MADYITIDGGTTNTRIFLVSDKKIVDFAKLSIGAAKCTDGNANLKQEIKNAINLLLSKNNKKQEDIHRILASGMITSEFGLCELKHITVPAGKKELHDTMHEVIIEEISDKIPFVFVRGVKCNTDNFETADMMRGEETELMGIIEKCNGLYILPGSHSKIISTDEKGNIINFKTMLTGEMFSALAKNTILKASIDFDCEEADQDYLLKGYNYALQNGLNDALFKTRILSNVFLCSKHQIYSYFLGVILCDEIKYILKQNPKFIFIGGKKQLKFGLFYLLNSLTEIKVFVIPDNDVDMACVKGIIDIYEYNE